MIFSSKSNLTLCIKLLNIKRPEWIGNGKVTGRKRTQVWQDSPLPSRTHPVPFLPNRACPFPFLSRSGQKTQKWQDFSCYMLDFIVTVTSDDTNSNLAPCQRQVNVSSQKVTTHGSVDIWRIKIPNLQFEFRQI
jgi:hypothetical protein